MWVQTRLPGQKRIELHELHAVWFSTKPQWINDGFLIVSIRLKFSERCTQCVLHTLCVSSIFLHVVIWLESFISHALRWVSVSLEWIKWGFSISIALLSIFNQAPCYSHVKLLLIKGINDTHLFDMQLNFQQLFLTSFSF